MASMDGLDELQLIYPGAKEMKEANVTYIHLPVLKLPPGNSPAEVEALLCPQQHSGYTTRLFLSRPIPNKGANWTIHRILDRAWHTWSWNNVSPGLRLAQILAEHLRALR